MKKENDKSYRTVALLAAVIAIIFSFFGSVSIPGINGYMQVALCLFVGCIVYWLFSFFAKVKVEDSTSQNILASLLSMLIILALIMTTWFSIQSLWINPFDSDGQRFVLENISTGTLIAAGILTLLLSTLQRDVYWMTKRKPGSLDEREVMERQRIFESSYKFGALLSLITIWGYLNNLGAITSIKEISGYSMHVPGRYFYPAYCLAIALFALPLITATFKNKKH